MEGKKLDFADLEDINVKSYTEHAKNGTLDEIENELALLGGISTIVPSNMAHLSEEEFVMCMLMYSNDVECEYTNKKTQGDVVSSFIMTFIENDTKMGRTIQYLVKKSFRKTNVITKSSREESNGGDYDETKLKEEYVSRYKIANYTSYMQLKAQAYAFWNRNNLKQYKKLITDLLSGGISDIEKFEDKVFDEAMNNDDPSIRARYAGIYSKNKGLDKSKGANIVNMFHYGGAETIQQLEKVSGNSRLGIQNILEADSEAIMIEEGDNDD